MKGTDRFFVQAKTGHWLASMEKGLHWGGRRQATTFTRAQIEARKELTGAKLIPAVRDNPGAIAMREIDHGFYRISDRDAGRLAKATPLGRLPRLGYELRDVRLPDGRTAILIRTPYSIRTDSPRRGWVWALYRIEAPRSNPRRASEARAKKRAPAKLRRRHLAIRARRVRRNPDPHRQRYVKLSDAQMAQLSGIAARKFSPSSPLRKMLLAHQAAPFGLDEREAAAAIARLRGGRVGGRKYPSGFVSYSPASVATRAARSALKGGRPPLREDYLQAAEETLTRSRVLSPIRGAGRRREIEHLAGLAEQALQHTRKNPRRWSLTGLPRTAAQIGGPRPLLVHAGWNKLKTIAVDAIDHTLATKLGRVEGYLHKTHGAKGWSFTLRPGVTIGRGAHARQALAKAQQLIEGFHSLGIFIDELQRRPHDYTIVT